MANKKLTAVELYIKESSKLIHLYKQKRITWTEYEINLKELQDSIKALEKEQIIDFHIETMKVGLIEEGSEKWNDGYLPLIKKTAEKHYNETYGNKESN